MAKAKNVDGPAQASLTPWELLGIERHERAVVEAQAQVTESGYKLAILKAEHDKLLQSLHLAQADARRTHERVCSDHANFLKTLATRYSVSWETHGFEPETGLINPIGA